MSCNRTGILALVVLLAGVLVAQEVPGPDERMKAGPYAMHPYDHDLVYDPLKEFQRTKAENYAALGRCLVDRYMAPYDAWITQTTDDSGQRQGAGELRGDTSALGRFPLDDTKVRWYLIRIRMDAYREAIYFRFSFDPAARLDWECPGDPPGQRMQNQDGTNTKEMMITYAMRRRSDIADGLHRYLVLLANSGNQDQKDDLVYGNAQLFWLAEADVDVTKVLKENEIK